MTGAGDDRSPAGDEGRGRGRMSESPHPPDRGQAEDRFARLFTGLDTQAQAYAVLDDLAEAEALAVAEIARINWADRLRAVTEVHLELPDGFVVSGEVAAVVADGVHLLTPGGSGPAEWIVRAEAVHAIHGLGQRTAGPSRVDRGLTVASILRGWAEDDSVIECWSARGRRTGTVIRVGADHLDLAEQRPLDLAEPRGGNVTDRSARCTLPLAGLWALSRR